MPPFKLSPEQEAARASVFPNMTPEEYAALLERNRAQFQALPPAEQALWRTKVDQWEAEFAAGQANPRLLEQERRSRVTTWKEDAQFVAEQVRINALIAQSHARVALAVAEKRAQQTERSGPAPKGGGDDAELAP